MNDSQPDCLIAGGGPAGLMVGYLLARQGVNVTVLEKHKDFLRDFRGDTVHPSTLELFHQLGLLDKLLARPHQKTSRVSIYLSGTPYKVADFSRLKVQCPYIAMMPQWDFLDVLADEAISLPTFKMMMSTEAIDLIEEDGKILGVSAKSRLKANAKPFDIRSSLTIAADGRGSVLRDASGLPLVDHGAPIDVFWMRLPRHKDTSEETFGRASKHGFLVMIDRGDYWQCALPLAKGSAETIREQGLPAFQHRIAQIVPSLEPVVDALKSWDDVKLLTVQVNRLTKWWRDGLLCIGDAAHAMSPIGGIGINLAIQDAVATARLLGPALKENRLSLGDLAAVQKRRNRPAALTQKSQITIQNRIIVPILENTKELKAPFPVKLLNRFGFLRGLPAKAIGIGLRPEYWRDNK